jgi:hypothetical protein
VLCWPLSCRARAAVGAVLMGWSGVRTRVVGGAMNAHTACWGGKLPQWREVQSSTRRRAVGFRCINIQGSGLSSSQGGGTRAPAALPRKRLLVAHSNANGPLTTGRAADCHGLNMRQIEPHSISNYPHARCTARERTRRPSAIGSPPPLLERHVFEQTTMHATAAPPPIPTRPRRLSRSS